MEEVYNIKELALALGIPWQTVMAWKRNHQIPTASMTPDGKFLKSVIDPFIEWYKSNPTVDSSISQDSTQELSLPKTKSQLSAMAKQKKKLPKNIREEAVCLLKEKNFPSQRSLSKSVVRIQVFFAGSKAMLIRMIRLYRKNLRRLPRLRH